MLVKEAIVSKWLTIYNIMDYFRPLNRLLGEIVVAIGLDRSLVGLANKVTLVIIINLGTRLGVFSGEDVAWWKLWRYIMCSMSIYLCLTLVPYWIMLYFCVMSSMKKFQFTESVSKQHYSSGSKIWRYIPMKAFGIKHHLQALQVTSNLAHYLEYERNGYNKINKSRK